MKTLRKKGIALFLIFLAMGLILAIYAVEEDYDNSGFIKSKDLKIEKKSPKLTQQHLKYSMQKKKILFDDKNKKQRALGRYSNITPDKKIDWSVVELEGKCDIPGADEMFGYKKKTLEMFNKITIDGKKITLPMTFEDLGKEYKEFENIDYIKISEENQPFIIKNTKNNYYIKVVSLVLIDNVGNESYAFEKYIDVYNKDYFIIQLTAESRTKKIYGLETQGFDSYFAKADLRVDNIGVGNTFNEMYAKFGEPSMAFLFEKGRRAVYQGVNKQGDIYTISFYSKSIKEGKDTIYPKPNVITDIEVYLGAGAFF
ncbi:hypothetical protein HMPREF0379_0119 [[Eubacterium] yurii subsp. margaretiae ATCC 43715]|nr:hypothetical protein HMPREF0379_0119 [[Eubacterium] yurii subsp. margaretiae ATCC 43715]